MRVQTQNIGIQLKSRAISDPAKFKASKGAVIQREDARTPKNPIKCHLKLPF
jgi:hypothetical protein